MSQSKHSHLSVLLETLPLELTELTLEHLPQHVEVDDTPHRLRRLEEVLSATTQSFTFSTPHVASAKAPYPPKLTSSSKDGITDVNTWIKQLEHWAALYVKTTENLVDRARYAIDQANLELWINACITLTPSQTQS